SPARRGLLVARRLAPEPRRVCAVRLFSGTRALAAKASAHAGRARPACASHHRHDPALSVAGDRLGSAGNRRALAGRDQGRIPEEASSHTGSGGVRLITAKTPRAPRKPFYGLLEDTRARSVLNFALEFSRRLGVSAVNKSYPGRISGASPLYTRPI